MQKRHDDSKACLVAGLLPGVNREPLKKIAPDPEVLLRLLYRWRDQAIKAGKEITRVAVAYETGRDGFWLARWLRERGIDAHVMHATSVAISREHRRAKTDRIDTAMLRRGFLGWLRGERGHCSMAAIPAIAEEDAKRPHRERESLVKERTRTINQMKAILTQLGARTFKPAARKAAEKINEVRTPKGVPLPPNAAAALRRHIEHFRLVNEQIKTIEARRGAPSARGLTAEARAEPQWPLPMGVPRSRTLPERGLLQLLEFVRLSNRSPSH